MKDFNELRDKAHKLKQSISGNEHLKNSVQVAANRLASADETINEMDSRLLVIETSKSVSGFFINLYLDYKQGTPVSPMAMADALIKGNVIAPGRSVEDNKKALETVIESCIVDSEETSKEFNDFFNLVWEGIVPIVQMYANVNYLKNQCYVNAYNSVKAAEEEKKQRRKKRK